MLRRSLVVCLVLILAGPAAAGAADLLASADEVYDRGGMENFKASLPLYAAAVEAQPDSFEAFWKSARAHRNYANEAKKADLAGWEDICRDEGRAAMAMGEKAIALNPERPEGHYYYGLSVGIYSDGVSILTALREGLKNKTQASFEKAYALDKAFNEGGPVLSLGRFWTVLPWPMQDKDKALGYLREYQAGPYFSASAEARVYLAELLQKMGGEAEKAEARALLTEASGSSDAYYARWAARLLEEMK
jgi:hypothetical protein